MTDYEIVKTLISTAVEICADKGWVIFSEMRLGHKEMPSKEVEEVIQARSDIMAEALLISGENEGFIDQVKKSVELDGVRVMMENNPETPLRDCFKYVYTVNKEFSNYVDGLVSDGIDMIFQDILADLMAKEITGDEEDSPNLVA